MVDPGDSVQFKDASKLSASRVLDMSQCQEVNRGDSYSGSGRALWVHTSFCWLDVSSTWNQRFRSLDAPRAFVLVRLCYSAVHRSDVSITTFQRFHVDVNASCVQKVSVSLWTRSPERTAGWKEELSEKRQDDILMFHFSFPLSRWADKRGTLEAGNQSVNQSTIDRTFS